MLVQHLKGIHLHRHGERNRAKSQGRGNHRHNGSQIKQYGIATLRNKFFLSQKLHRVGQQLHEPQRTHAIGSKAVLNVRGPAPFHPNEQGNDLHHHQKDGDHFREIDTDLKNICTHELIHYSHSKAFDLTSQNRPNIKTARKNPIAPKM